ncbi:MAG: ribbon-helix-helix protein, CopG family [Coriobacteriia bacterium]|nr:ribbon-helix-helix protein, CopG family [Coriobacteriia bacterium]
MAVEKFSISLPEELVAEIDDLAKAEGVTRSGLVREATTEYVIARRSKTYEADRRRRIGTAIDGLKALSGQWGSKEKSGLEMLHELREERMCRYDDPEDAVDE